MMCGSDTKEFEIFLRRHKPLPTPATFRDGELLDEWRITAFLGKGGSGEVYRAEHVKDSRSVALKVHVRLSGKSDSQENSARERFEREVRILSGNTYSFFPKLYECGESCGNLYFAMELLEPISLPDADAAIASFLLELCRAVRVLHGNGIVHRDIKPQNIMRRANGQLVLIDLGLVKESASFTDHSGTSVTIVDGKVVGVGTPRYAAPEQFNGGVVSPATDIHALGMLANECFGGSPPRVWERIISRSTSSIPERRYEDIDAFTKAIRHRHYGRILAGCMVPTVIIGAVAIVLFNGRARTTAAPQPRPTWHSLVSDFSTNIVERQVVSETFATNASGVVMKTGQRWRTVTNAVSGSILQLNGRTHRFQEPILLDVNRHYWVVGPGTLDASIEGKPGAQLYLDECVLINRTTNSLKRCGVHYFPHKGVYLNFINQDRNRDWQTYVEDLDGAYNTLEFKGPESRAELRNRQKADSDRRLDDM